MEYDLKIAGRDFEVLKKHLYPGDGYEAIAIAICGRYNGTDSSAILVNELILIPHEDCFVRNPDRVSWSTKKLLPHLEKVSKKNLAVLKIHSHPNGYRDFSFMDDESDKELFDSIFGWMESDEPHASAIMLPNGQIFARVFKADLSHSPIRKVAISGDDLYFWSEKQHLENEEFSLRTRQVFGEGTTAKLKGMKVGIVGCSGTGSPLIEQLARLGVGQMVLIDPDIIEKKNLNRIINSTFEDAIAGNYKVDVLKTAIQKMGIGTQVTSINKNLFSSKENIELLAGCDIIFGCVDSIDGRHLINQIATFYLIPYFDLGIKLISDGKGGIDQIMGTVHYIQPGKSSLITRGVYTSEGLRAASLFRTNRLHYEEQKKSSYIVDIPVESPAVVSINSQVASMAVNEFLARLHPFRYDENKEFAINRISFTDGYMQHEAENGTDKYLIKFVGRGNMIPLLNMPEL